MAQEICDKLLINPNGNYLDGTLGGGGHAEFLLEKLNPSACYIAIDRDAEALAFAAERLQRFSNVVFYQGLFSEMDAALQKAEVESVDGILLDLGVSSHQIDSDGRGFAFRPGNALDMRMNTEDALTAADILNTYDVKELTAIFKQYGEERHSGRIAREIVKRRSSEEIVKSNQLMEIIQRCVQGKFLTKSYARIFQALRIEVNRELSVLEEALENALRVLKPGGRIAVLSYHSLEDRIVKNFIRRQENPCTCPPEIPYCVCGKKPQLKKLKPAFISAGAEEIKNNPRARSAKLRVGEKI
jgi:16S rRNA (cytosine1402-N4)-methyltransferase